ncbi:MAG: DUF1345 domain-containing protein [Synechococcaceae cyanobacterium]|jgi:uncharacterized membrane protein
MNRDPYGAPSLQATMALPKEMREIRRIMMALSLGIVVTLVVNLWGRFAEALTIGILVAMVYDLLRVARAAVLLDGRQSRAIFASLQPRRGSLLRRTVMYTFVSVFVLSLCVYDIKQVAGLIPDHARVGLFFAALFAAWVELHLGFALYYAKVYYHLNPLPAASGNSPQGFIFPGNDEPLFTDFLYVAYVVGLTSAMSDVSIEDGLIRRVVLSQAIVSFLFYSTIFSVITNLMMGGTT